MPKFVQALTVSRVHFLTEGCFVMDLRCPAPFPVFEAGQFVQVRMPQAEGVYLRRPFSVYSTDKLAGTFSILVKIVGKGTQALSLLKAGDPLDVIYPLGNSFSMPKSGKALLVGGGVGIAPLLMQARALHEAGIAIDLVAGGRTSSDLYAPEAFDGLAGIHLCTDDGSLGHHGLVTTHPILQHHLQDYAFVYSCGPDPMMRAVARLCFPLGVRCEVSLEHLMACGFGVCLCCVASTRAGNVTTCVEGPVFDTSLLNGYQ